MGTFYAIAINISVEMAPRFAQKTVPLKKNKYLIGSTLWSFIAILNEF